MKELLEQLKALYKGGETGMEEGSHPDDYAGGNYDDAYYAGVEHGSNAAYKHAKQLIEAYEAKQK